MRVDLEEFRERVAACDDEIVLEMAPAAIAEIEYLRAEIARLRLTYAEREAVEDAIALVEATAEKLDSEHCRSTVSHYGSMSATLRGLLERLK